MMGSVPMPNSGRYIYQRANLAVHVFVRGSSQDQRRYYEARRRAWLEQLSRTELSQIAIGAHRVQP